MTNGAVEVYIPFWKKEREARVWDFKRKVGNSQLDEKKQTFNKQILSGSPRNNGTQKEV